MPIQVTSIPIRAVRTTKSHLTPVPCQRLIFYHNFCVEEAGIGLTNTGQLLFPASKLKTDWRGITGLETAIVLVAFILVATVFAFAVLSTGLVASEKSKEAALGSLKEASGTLMVRGRVVGTSNNALTALDQVKFTLSSATQANEGVEFTTAASVISYLDENQAVNLAASDWTPTWLIGSGPVVDAGEQVEIAVTLSGLILPPGKGTDFTLRVQSAVGAEVYLQKSVPAELTKVVELISGGSSSPAPTNSTLEFDVLQGKNPKVFPISGIMYVIAYEGDSDNGTLKTFTMAPNGRIIETVNDTLTFDNVKGKDADIVSISGNVYAITYTDDDDDGWLKTVTIAPNGQITDSLVDTLEFDTVKGKNANIIRVSSIVYAIAYSGDNDIGLLKTVTIATDGQITDTVIDTLEFDTSKGKTPNRYSGGICGDYTKVERSKVD